MNQPDVLNRELILQLKAGNQDAFKRVYTEYYKKLCAFAIQYVSIEESEGIVQEVMLWLWGSRASIIPDMNLKSLLFTIVKNKSLNKIKHKKIKNSVCEKFREIYSSKFDDPDFYVYDDLKRNFEKALQVLPEDYREAFLMNRFRNLSYNEIAKIKGISSKTVAYRISKALEILRVELKDYLPLVLLLLRMMFVINNNQSSLKTDTTRQLQNYLISAQSENINKSTERKVLKMRT